MFQVITTILNHITRGHPPITVKKEGKISRDFFKSRSSDGKQCRGDESRKNKDNKALEEENMLIYRNYMVRGVIDKGQFGEYGLVHTVQELFGPNTAGTLLSVMSRLFTAYLQVCIIIFGCLLRHFRFISQFHCLGSILML